MGRAADGDPASAHLRVALLILRVGELIESLDTSGVEPLGPTPIRYSARVLLLLTIDGERTMGSLSRALRRHPTTLTHTVDQLERRGLVARMPHAQDRRATIVRITESGRAGVERLARQLRGSVRALGGLSSGDAEQLVVLLGKVGGIDGDGPLAAGVDDGRSNRQPDQRSSRWPNTAPSARSRSTTR